MTFKLKLREDRMLMPHEAQELREKIAKLRAALEPFAKIAAETRPDLDLGGYREYTMDDDEYISVYHLDIRVKHFRAAETALKESE